MIYAPGRFLFVHVPRCAGNALAVACAPLIADGEIVINTLARPRGVLGGRHARAVELRHALPDFGVIWRWAVVRNPWDLVASDYRLTWRDADRRNTPAADQTTTSEWLERLSRFEESDRSFEAFVRREFEFLRRARGFYRYWCCDDGEPLAEPFRYDRLDAEWQRIRSGIRAGEAILPESLPRINAGAGIPVRWTRSLIDHVGELCIDDVERFGFEPPAITDIEH